jgi:hypothetical protein
MSDQQHHRPETRIHIDEERHFSPNPTAGAALYVLGKVRDGYELFKEVEGDREDPPVPNDDTLIHLREDEHFHSAERKQEEPHVEFEDVNSLEKAEFRTPWSTKLTDAWNEAARLLEEPRKPNDHLQTPDGKDLTPYLELTLRELKERKIVHALKFEIAGPTGGAACR